MPKLHEAQRKITIIKHGGDVRPPLNWWNKMIPTIKREYSGYSENETNQVLGGIWNSYSDDTKIKIIREYQTDN